MTSSKFITFTIVNEHTAMLTLNRPPANALNFEFLDDLERDLNKLNASDDIRVVILASGSSKFFVSGADIKEMSAITTEEEGRKFSEKGHAVMNRIHLASKPYIAAIDGVCMGGGLELALACHLRIAGSEAKLGFPEVNLGLMPGFGGTQRLTQIVGKARALEMMLTGKQLTADEALKIGLVNQVVKQGQAFEAALNLAEQIQSKSVLSITAILNAVSNPDYETLADRLNNEQDLFGKLFTSPHSQEGMQAFLEKRLPDFKDE